MIDAPVHAEAIHVVAPFRTIARAVVRRRETVQGFLRRTGWDTARLPTVCTINGEPWLRRDWAKRIPAGASVAFVSRPLGGGRGGVKQVIGLVSMIALAVLAPWAGGAFAAGLGIAETAGFAFTAAKALGSALFMVGGSFLVSALVGPQAGAQAQGSADPIYSLSVQGNAARPLQPRKIAYGKVLDAPDFAAPPWMSFTGNDQYVHVLLYEGDGKYEFHEHRFDDTVFWTAAGGVQNFEGIEIAHYEPGQAVTLFPVNVATASEVSGQTLDIQNGWIGPFVVNAAGTEATRIGVDLVFPAGLYGMNNNGAILSASVPVEVQAIPVNSAGAPSGPAVTIISETISAATQTPKRVSLEADIAAGRYSVKVRRTTAPKTSGGADAVAWASCRAYVRGGNTFPGTVTALRMKANSQLNETTARRIKTLKTRKVKVYQGGAWVDDVASRNPAWALLDCATRCGFASTKINLAKLVTLAATWDARGDCFDYVFESAVTEADAFDTILRAGRAKHRFLGDRLDFIRDEWPVAPSRVITDRESVSGSFGFRQTFALDQSADAIIVQYLDGETWGPAEVQVPSDVVAVRPVYIRLSGVTQYAQAYREAAFMWRASLYRRVRPRVEMEHDGRMMAFGDHVLLQADMPQSWGTAHHVTGLSSLTVTVSPAPDWTGAAQKYVTIRTRSGQAFGPIRASRGAADDKAVLLSADVASVSATLGVTLAQAVARADGGDGASLAFGAGTAWQKRCIIAEGSPRGDRTRLELIVDDERVHDESAPIPTPPTYTTVPIVPARPVVYGLVGMWRSGVAEPVIEASWQPAIGARRYMVEISADAGVSWTPAGTTNAIAMTIVAPAPVATRVRVAAVGAQVGPWAEISLAAPTIGVIGTDALDASVRQQLAETSSRMASVEAALCELAFASGQFFDGHELDRDEYTQRLDAHAGDLTGVIQELNYIRVGDGTVRALRLESVEAGLAERATVEAFTALDAQVQEIDGVVTATATALTSVEASVGAISAGGKIHFSAVTAPTGSTAAVEMSVYADPGTGPQEYAAMTLLANSDGTSAIVQDADYHYIKSSGSTFKKTDAVTAKETLYRLDGTKFKETDAVAGTEKYFQTV